MSDPLDKLKQWRETTEKATEGPWWRFVHRDETNEAIRTDLFAGDGSGDSPMVAEGLRLSDADAVLIARTAMPRLLDAVENVLDLHRPFKVYDECECTDERKDDGYHVEVNDIGLTCNHIYTVCGECCTDDEYVTEACSYHVHREGEPICPTVKAIRDALGGAK